MDIDVTFVDSDDVPDDNMSQPALREAIREYAAGRGIADITPEVEVQISRKMKRAAGKAIQQSRPGRKPYVLRFAWAAYQEWGWDDRFRGVIDHELVHLWEYQEYGTSDHGSRFKARANQEDAPLSCEKFSDHDYEILCSDCGRVVAERYQRSKMVKQPMRYKSQCCSAPCESREV